MAKASDYAAAAVFVVKNYDEPVFLGFLLKVLSTEPISMTWMIL